MKFSKIHIVVTMSAAVLLTGCFGSNNSDLTDYINETKRRPKRDIDPVPSFRPYQPFVYDAQRLRDPFERPVSELQNIVLTGQETVKPDPNRPKEALEEFNFAELSMQGSYRDKHSVLWALVKDGRGDVQPVKEGNYMGKNHGRIVEITQNQVSVVEIVPDGVENWLQRPRSLKLNEKE